MQDKLFDLSGDISLNSSPFDTAAEAVSAKLDELLSKMNAVEEKAKTVFNGTNAGSGWFDGGNDEDSYSGNGSGGGSSETSDSGGENPFSDLFGDSGSGNDAGGSSVGDLFDNSSVGDIFDNSSIGDLLGMGSGGGLLGGLDLSSIANEAIGTAAGNIASDAVQGLGQLVGKLFGGQKNADIPVNLVLAEGSSVQSQIDTMIGENLPVIKVNISALDVETASEDINESISQIQSRLNPLVVPVQTEDILSTNGSTSPLDYALAKPVNNPLAIVNTDQKPRPESQISESNRGWQGALSSFGGWLADNDDDADGATKDIAGALLGGKSDLFDLLIDTGVNQSLNATGYILQDAAGWLSPVPESFSGNVRIGNEEYSYPMYVAKEDRGFLGVYRPDTANKTFGISPRDQRILSRQSGGMNQPMFDLLPTEDMFFSSVAANLGSYAPGSTIPVSGLFDFDASNLLERLQEEFPEFNFEAVPELPDDAASKMQSQLNGMELSVPVNAYMSGGFDWRGGFDGTGTSFVDDVTKAFKNVSVVLDSGAIAGSVNDRLGRSSALG